MFTSAPSAPSGRVTRDVSSGTCRFPSQRQASHAVLDASISQPISRPSTSDVSHTASKISCTPSTLRDATLEARWSR
eukprot:scaffold64614_cov48-Phaeocystis_antarctica.AAC.1